jgi:selenocysteine-specific elongation factor
VYTIGTAGHVDHGKSTLVRALTGIDPDRLQEEKARGMTIDLGFAWLILPSGREISVVDVPGHERFIKNMLAGVGGIDAALLVIAADEGVMPQTREHLAILDLLHVRNGAVVLTKRDLVDEEWLELVKEDARQVLLGTTLEHAPMVSVSAVTGEGLNELVALLDRLLDQTAPRRDVGRPRLPIDRVFSIGGFGTVVTGTLLDGSLYVGQELEVLPAGLRVRARGLQSHRHRVERIAPGNRVAVNLAGVEVNQLQRGDVLTVPGGLSVTRVLDVRLRLLGSAPKPLANSAEVTFHVGTAELPAQVRLLDRDELAPGQSGWAQLRLAGPVAVAKGDLFIIRQPSPSLTLGGGEIVHVGAVRRRRFRDDVLEELQALAEGDPEEVLLRIVRRREPVEQRTALEAGGLARRVAEPALAALLQSGRLIALGQTLVTAEGWQGLAARLRAELQSYHSTYPLRAGMPKEELRMRSRLNGRAFAEALSRLVQAGVLVDSGTTVRLPEHAVRFDGDLGRRVEAALAALAADPFSPPGLAELQARYGLDEEVIGALVEAGRIVRLSHDVLFTPEAYQQAVTTVAEIIRREGKVTVAQVRDVLNTSRKYALALMEYLDARRITRRIGDERVLAR